MKLSNFKFQFILIAVFIVLVEGCSYRKNKDSGNLSDTVFSREQLESISFQEVKNKVFIPKCITCHGTSGGVNLENYSNAVSHLEQINQTSLINKSMPKSGSVMLTPEEYMILATWVKAGGPETPANGGNAPPPLPIEILKPEFTSIKKLIIDKKCLSCHGVGKKASRVPLNTPDEMINSPLEIIIPGNPEESGLILSLDRETATKPMPPKKSGISAVSAEEIETIKEWIIKGAKNN